MKRMGTLMFMNNIIKNEKVLWPHVYELRYQLIIDSNKELSQDNVWHICMWLLWGKHSYF